MGKIKSKLCNMSLKASFSFYVLIGLLCALLLSAASNGMCQITRKNIHDKYFEQYKDEAGTSGSIISEDGNIAVGEIAVYTKDIISFFSTEDKIAYRIFDILSIIVFPFWFLTCIIITGKLFFSKKLQKPLELLDNAADNIANNTLDFHLVYENDDEMGKLCSSFEKMRIALQENNLEMWRQMEERKRLNAAFSHELRTPLTVLKGQSEMLLKYVPDGKITVEKIIDITGTMKSHIIRLENYVSTMNSLQNLADIEIQKAEVPAAKIKNSMKEHGMMICAGKELIFDDTQFTAGRINVDISVVMQVYENILSNAVRFAQYNITVVLSDDKVFSMSVSDDGRGFTEKELAEATKPFYKSNDNTDNQHFGIGLNICKILCEKHGGYLKLSNNSKGATVRAVF